VDVAVGVIGGSGFYDLPGFTVRDRLRPDTPFGPPSGEIVLGELGGVGVAFVARHGAGHVHPPRDVPYRANIWALRALGVHTVVGVNAVGSLDEDYAPGHLVLPDDLFDRTTQRAASFFGPGLVVHVGLAEPCCRGVRRALLDAAGAVDTPVHDGGTLVVVEGPRFSTPAESRSYRSDGFRLIGMTTLPEAALAREAELCYAALSVVTDYDVWHATEAPVTVDMIVRTLLETVRQAQHLLSTALPALAARADCPCRHALADAITTAPGAVDPEMAARLDLLVGRYLRQ
jgi:5'-methylthioadenosine phosphorylase